jgi:pimeloyl-ACP methyl ester carboxylesterase
MGREHLVGLAALTLMACKEDASFAPSFAETDCAFALPEGHLDSRVRCGTLTVAADRSAPGDAQLELPVAVFESTGPSPSPEPLVFLGGGPGAPSLGNYTDQYAVALTTWRAQRDVVFFDQRGTGSATPSLACPEFDVAFNQAAAEPLETPVQMERLVDSMRACHERLLGEGVEPAHYTSATSAADMVDLIGVLGWDRADLYGISYGTRVAQVAMRDAPDRVRSAVLDSTVPLVHEQALHAASSLEATLQELADRCAADAVCAVEHPDWHPALYELVTELNSTPETLDAVHFESGEAFTFVMTGDRLLWGVFQSLYQRAILGSIPALVDAAAADDFFLLTIGLGTLPRSSTLAMGQYYSVICNERTPFLGSEAVEAARGEARPDVERVMLDAIGPGMALEVCDFWGIGSPSSEENTPLVSDIPTLIVGGQFDPVTPPDLGEAVGQSLSASQFYEFPDFGHGILRTDAGETADPWCAIAMTDAFLADPTAPVDDSCIDGVPPIAFD